MQLESSRQQLIYHGIACVQGKASGPLIASNLELSFWGGVDPQTSEIIDRHHPLSGKYIRDAILAIPGGRGSCSGSGILLELLLSGKGPKALVFSRREDILTLGVVVAEEIFRKSIPVVILAMEDFHELLSTGYVFVNGNTVSGAQPDDERQNFEHGVEEPLDTALSSHFELSDEDQEFLEGLHGRAAQAAMRIILRMAAMEGARELINITQGGKVLVPTTLNSISMDQKRWRAQGVASAFGEAAERLALAYTNMGALPTFTYAPYLLSSAPRQGDQVAWAESNAVVYANSVLAGNRIPVITGLDILHPSTDNLKAFRAAFATMASAPMFHIIGVTPEAATLQDTTSKRGTIENPHFSIAKIRKLAKICQGRAKHNRVSVIVTCGRATYRLAMQAGLVEELQQFGIQFITNTCWCMISEPVIPTTAKTIMTNSTNGL
ncbi:hypothetical protein Trco_008312 [Trichoderma cornu-damae]|uniref:Uncharacterized protein n=1 Tax=Trichoderma cornu-damae TaxID=654480 RepID=A0A9P8QJL2_9HYPO|nr:hypothetical protein Trco_008312 [Trichoderma cornu-damae]